MGVSTAFGDSAQETPTLVGLSSFFQKKRARGIGLAGGVAKFDLLARTSIPEIRILVVLAPLTTAPSAAFKLSDRLDLNHRSGGMPIDPARPQVCELCFSVVSRFVVKMW